MIFEHLVIHYLTDRKEYYMQNNFAQKGLKERPEIQTSLFMGPTSYPNKNSNSQDYSLERNIRRISPAPHQRFSQVPTPTPSLTLKRYASNDYQMTPRISQFIPTPDHSKFIYDLMQRIEKLESKNEKWEKLEARVHRMQSNNIKISAKMEHLGNSRQNSSSGKENQLNLSNRTSEELPKSRQKSQFVTREELKKDMGHLSDAFKNVFDGLKTSISTEMGQYNTKSKKKFIQITATQLSEKLQHFKANFIKEWNSQIQKVVKQTWNKELVGKTVIGVSKQKFFGTAFPLKLKEQLTVSTSQNSQKELLTQETTYYVDRYGYLLDSNKYYLLDKNEKQIKLSEQHLEVLKKEGIIVSHMSSPKQNILSRSLQSTLTKSKSFI